MFFFYGAKCFFKVCAYKDSKQAMGKRFEGEKKTAGINYQNLHDKYPIACFKQNLKA
jgi:hypothetical protein